MRKTLFCCAFILTVSVAACQKINFVEQLGIGYTSGVNANSFSEAGNTGGFAFGTTADFLLHNLVGIGLGFDINILKMTNVTQSISPIFADVKIIGRGKFRPYLVIDPGYCLYYASRPDGTVQKGSFYAGGGAGLWFPSKRLLHIFLQAKYNYLTVKNTNNSYAPNSTGYLSTFNFMVGYKF